MATILITGASRGIGFEIARQYAADGDRVYATCRTPEKADKLNAAARGSGGRLTVHKMDVADGDSVKACAREIGDATIDVLINNAGVWGGLETQVLENMDYDNWAYELSVMAMGPMRVVQAFLPNVLKSKNPKIVTVTSQTSAHSYKKIAGYAYSSAKAACNRIMTIMANDLKDKGVAVYLMHPGWVQTDMAGPKADIPPHESATGVRKTIANATLADTGKFLTWEGGIHAW